MSVLSQKDELLFCCLKIGLPDKAADDVIQFCKKHKITRIFSPGNFLVAWKNNPRRAEIELNNYVKERERRFDKEKKQNQAAVHSLLQMFEAKFGKLDIALKTVEMPKARPNEKNRILDAWGVK